MALDKITTTMITDEAVTTAKLGPSAVTGAKIGADAIDITDLGTIMSVGETAPSGPFIGQRWYRASTAITYQYTNDGTSSFWLDVSSSGIGTSAERGVDFVGDTDPHLETNGTGLAIGSVYYNREKNKHFVCTTATTNSNVWSGRYSSVGGVETTYKSGSTFYRVHTFLVSGTFVTDSATSIDYLIVAGGGGGGKDLYSGGRGGGGAGAGGFRTGANYSLAGGEYTITVGLGGAAASGVNSQAGVTGTSGGNSSIAALVVSAGGGGGGGHTTGSNFVGVAGGSGGGGGNNSAGGAGNTPSTSPVQGFAGGTGYTLGPYWGGGGGGASAVGSAGTSTTGGIGGAGAANAYRTGSNVTYAGGGGGAGSGTNQGTGGAGGGGNAATAGTVNTGGGGGAGSTYKSINPAAGGSGIVIVRYAL
jgi:hypothetical protein